MSECVYVASSNIYWYRSIYNSITRFNFKKATHNGYKLLHVPHTNNTIISCRARMCLFVISIRYSKIYENINGKQCFFIIITFNFAWDDGITWGSYSGIHLLFIVVYVYLIINNKFITKINWMKVMEWFLLISTVIIFEMTIENDWIE